MKAWLRKKTLPLRLWIIRKFFYPAKGCGTSVPIVVDGKWYTLTNKLTDEDVDKILR